MSRVRTYVANNRRKEITIIINQKNYYLIWRTKQLIKLNKKIFG